MGLFDKIKTSIAKAKIATAVGKVILTGKGSKTLEKVDKYSDIALQALSAIELAKELIKR